jgi:FAD/FMN-containing dehydrogenase
MSQPVEPNETAVNALGDRINGALLHPGDDGYHDARTVWNGMVEKYPSYVVRCMDADDVVAGVTFAREHGLLLGVKGGGHNVAGKAIPDDGLLLDLSAMDSVQVDPEAQTARVGPGATWGDFDGEAQQFGLATTGGVDSRTGVAGLALGGGIGWLARTYGLSTDNLWAVELVTADGAHVRASETEQPELFWGVRGGGGNFGVVTAFEFDLHEVGPEVLTAQRFYPFDQTEAVLHEYREFMADAPPEVACYAFVLNVPPEPPFPEERYGEAMAALVACYTGSVEDGEAALAPLTEVGEPMLEVFAPMSYTDLQSNFDDGYPDGERYYWKSAYVESITDELIETVVDHTDPLPGPFTGVFFEPMGGAIAEVDPTETAFPHRHARYNLGIAAGWSDPAADDQYIEWTREFHDAVAPHATGGVYANYLDRDDEDRTADAYQENYDRLVELKREWDPENLFRLNTNVSPDGSDG